MFRAQENNVTSWPNQVNNFYYRILQVQVKKNPCRAKKPVTLIWLSILLQQEQASRQMGEAFTGHCTLLPQPLMQTIAAQMSHIYHRSLSCNSISMYDLIIIKNTEITRHFFSGIYPLQAFK